jgi:hypothetical protein
VSTRQILEGLVKHSTMTHGDIVHAVQREKSVCLLKMQRIGQSHRGGVDLSCSVLGLLLLEETARSYVRSCHMSIGNQLANQHCHLSRSRLRFQIVIRQIRLGLLVNNSRVSCSSELTM